MLAKIDNPNNVQEAILIAAKSGHLGVIKSLVTFTDTSKVPTIYYNWTPIHIAGQYGHTDIVKVLLNYTDSPNPSDNIGRTPISFAAQYGYTETVRPCCIIQTLPMLQTDMGRH